MTPATVKSSTLGEAADASPGKTGDVAPDNNADDTPASCVSVPVSDDGVPVPDGSTLFLGCTCSDPR